jgi:hypothetical protein
MTRCSCTGGLSVENDAESVEEIVRHAADAIARFDAHRRHLIDRGIVLPFSTFGEILTAVALVFEGWISACSQARRRLVSAAAHADT